MVDVRRVPGAAEWEVGDVRFVSGFGLESTADRFFIRKPPDLFERYLDLANRFRHASIVELGIAAGGSTALLSLLAEPRLLIACELDEEPRPGLAALIDARGMAGEVRPFYGVDQSDRARLAELVDGCLGGGELDLVIDDASHRYRETRASFEVLFPRLRPGGWFIIEDWAADYSYAERIARTLRAGTPEASELEARLATAAEQPEPPLPLSRLGVELLQVCGAGKEVLSELRIDSHWIVVERGPAALDTRSFRVRDHYVDHWGWFPE